MTEQQKKQKVVLQELMAGNCRYDNKRIAELFPELFQEEKPERKFIDVRVEYSLLKSYFPLNTQNIRQCLLDVSHFESAFAFEVSELPKQWTDKDMIEFAHSWYYGDTYHIEEHLNKFKATKQK